jgi:hypothetical protein
MCGRGQASRLSLLGGAGVGWRAHAWPAALGRMTQTRAQRLATSPLLQWGPTSQHCWTRSHSPTPTTPATPSTALSSPRTRTIRIGVSIAGGSAELEDDDHRAHLLDLGGESNAGYRGEASRSAPLRKHRSGTRYAAASTVVSAEKPSGLAAQDAHPTTAFPSPNHCLSCRHTHLPQAPCLCPAMSPPPSHEAPRTTPVAHRGKGRWEGVGEKRTSSLDSDPSARLLCAHVSTKMF